MGRTMPLNWMIATDGLAVGAGLWETGAFTATELFDTPTHSGIHLGHGDFVREFPILSEACHNDPRSSILST